jgi:integration host factor subunit beta
LNKSDLVEAVAENIHLQKENAEKVVDFLFSAMTDALARGDRIEIRGFGSFIPKQHHARTGRNPRTGENISVPSKRLPFFKVGKELKDRVNAR